MMDASGLQHCKEGQETVHEIVTKTQELFNTLKIRGPVLSQGQQSSEEEKKKIRVKDYLNLIQQLFSNLRYHYDSANEACASLSHIQIESLIPYKDDLESFEQIQKHTRSLVDKIYPEYLSSKEELLSKINTKDEQLRKITDELRDFMYEINTMLDTAQTS